MNVLFNSLSAVLSLFSFASIIPVLRLLFGVESGSLSYMSFSQAEWKDYALIIKNNIYCYLQQQVDIGGASRMLLVLGLFLIVMTFLKCLTAWLGAYFMIPIRTGVLRDLRRDLYRKILDLPIGFYTEEKKGDVMSRMTNDVQEVESSIMASLDLLLKDPLVILIYLVSLFVISWQLTFFVLILLPISGWIIGQVGKSLKRKSTRGQELLGELVSQVDETLGGMRVVKGFAAEKRMERRFADLNEEIRRTFNRIQRRYQLAHPMSEFLGTVVIATLLWYGGSLILGDVEIISAAEFIYYLVVFYLIINPAKDLTKAVYSVRKGLASLERIDKILHEKGENEDVKEGMNSVELPLPMVIKYEDVHFGYGDKEVIKGIDVTIEQGKTIAFVGQSGAGKTTILDLLPRFYRIQKGRITISGIDINDIGLAQLRGMMGIVSQEPVLFNDSFFNNISFGVDGATMEAVVEAAKVANAHEFIEQAGGYDQLIGERGGKLSGGQRQRISIARAVLKNPPILILDEATSALDTESEKLVQEALERLMKNRTTLVVAHRLSTIKNADEICVVSDGKIIERGNHNELINANGYYKKLIQMQGM